jgi:DNA polymerase-3 subunit delta'
VSEAIAVADAIEGVAHPRETTRLVGHAAAERTLLDAYRAGRLHHAWLLAGPRGIGKATLAYRLARFMLAYPDPAQPAVAAAETLAVAPEAPAARRIAQGAHPDLAVLSRGLNADRKNFSAEIKVDDARRLSGLFGSTAGEGGWRVAIVDTADDLNTNAANALLKLVEEPPPRSIFIILTASPRALPATLRSRCRLLQLRPLDTGDVAAVLAGLAGIADEHDPDALARAAASSGGSVRRAIAALTAEDTDVAARTAAALKALPDLSPAGSLDLADAVTAGREAGLAAFVEQVLDFLHARAVMPGAPAARLARWAELWEKVAAAARDVEAYNLDRRPFVLSTLTMIAAAAR